MQRSYTQMSLQSPWVKSFQEQRNSYWAS